MKRLVLIVGVLVCLGFQSPLEARGAKRYTKKETTVDMSATKTVFVGWVDMAEDWGVLGYSTKTEWEDVVNGLNNGFQRLCQTKWLLGKTVIGAKDSKDENAAGQDLYIKFSDVRVDYDNYLLYLSIHFIDPKTNAEIASIPDRPYFGNDWGVAKYLKAALDEVNQKIHVEVTGTKAEK